MRHTCRKCGHVEDIRDAVIVAANAAIVAKRRRRAGNEMTSDQARERQALGAAARRANAAGRQAAG